MPTTKTELIDSFLQLKKKARSMLDIEQWFVVNPQFIPGLPEALIPYVEMHICYPNTHIELTYKDDEIALLLTLEYSAELPEEKATGLTTPAFEAFFGTRVGLSNPNTRLSKMTNKVTLVLPALEWTFVAASATREFLDSPDSYDARYAMKIKEVWDETFANPAWAVLQDMSGSNLLPEGYHEFINWAFTNTFAPNDSLQLPNELTHD